MMVKEVRRTSKTLLHLPLIQTTNALVLGADIDSDNDAVPDGVFTNWTVLDSVGVLDNDGLGDIAYGAINFRRDASPGSRRRPRA
jgi:hypothetical protein